MKGIYALVIRIDREATLNVGALGETAFKKGLYVYVGSAQTNLEHRVKRHLRKNKRIFWHIDYLLSSDAAKIEKVLYLDAGKAEECVVAHELGKHGATIVGFGCSDCRCKSHLFLLENAEFLGRLMQEFDVET